MHIVLYLYYKINLDINISKIEYKVFAVKKKDKLYIILSLIEIITK